eukprot:CAMPEP_0202953646 /NCGR_PEP_ID=MMETSP1395-20130829/47492_1 /ASSEMBLY_ACC=CAM_ASM_000871 /TAXON_ID=5961 /ORGANISM="Blepharisma japonicum, Strain Stock R1072" /LENGTH=74 /DNA_ID=CAMNT_0049667773 /DNA_START=31 /DNA_END=255 /DNA_ORIENTATION=+
MKESGKMGNKMDLGLKTDLMELDFQEILRMGKRMEKESSFEQMGLCLMEIFLTTKLLGMGNMIGLMVDLMKDGD